MLIVLQKLCHDEHLSQPLQTKIKQYKLAFIFLTGFNCIFNVTNSINKLCSPKSNTHKDALVEISIPPGAYKVESSNYEIKRIIIDESHFTVTNYPFTIKPKFSNLGSIIEIHKKKYQELVFCLMIAYESF